MIRGDDHPSSSKYTFSCHEFGAHYLRENLIGSYSLITHDPVGYELSRISCRTLILHSA